MFSSTFFRKTVATVLIPTFIAMVNPLITVSAMALIVEVVPIPALSNNNTPNYIFNTDSTGSINYSGSCLSTTNIATAGDNDITFNAFSDGTYSNCSITVDDGSGVSNMLALTSFTIDTTLPTINLIGSGIVNMIVGSVYSDSGATWTDIVDGSGIIVTYNSGILNTSQTGTYMIGYLKVDAAGNTGSTTRIVNVLDAPADTTPPVVTLIGSGTINILSGSTYVDSGATWSDNVDGTGNTLTGTYANTGSFQSSGSVNTSQTGTYVINYLKVDAAGNTGSTTRTVNVLDVIPPDTTPPVVTLIGSGTINILSGSTYVDSGATWSDNVDGTGNTLTGTYANTGSFQSSGSVNTSQTGTYVINYLKVDTAGNTGSTTRTVNVLTSIPDTTSPTVTINIKSGQLDPTTTSPVYFTAVFSEPINVASFTRSTISTSGSTASGIVINSITEVAPNDGTTFDISVSMTSTGDVVLSIPQGTGAALSILGVTGSGVYDLTIDPAGNIYTANYFSGTVTKITPQGVSSILGITGSGNGPRSIAIDPAGNIYTANFISDTVTKITPQGVSSILGATGSGSWPRDITIDSAGNIYTANYFSDTVTKITLQGVSSTLGSTGFGPVAIAIDPAGNIYTANYLSNTVTKITPQGVSSILGITGSGSGPRSIAIDSAGNIYTANYFSSNVTKITPQGVSSILGNTSSGAYAITIDPAGNIYTANYLSNTVTKITPQGVSSTLGTTGSGSWPIGITIDPAGNIYTANYASSTVTKISPAGITDLAGNYNMTSTSTDNRITVSFLDTISPVITLVGNTNLSIPLGGIYGDLGATWTDNVDGSGTIVANGTVNTSIAGLYILVYNHTDMAGNVGVFERRYVTVVAPEPPQVIITGAGGGGGGSSYGMPVYVQPASRQTTTLNSASSKKPVTYRTSTLIGSYRSKLYKSLVELRMKKFPNSEFTLKRRQSSSSSASNESMSISQ